MRIITCLTFCLLLWAPLNGVRAETVDLCDRQQATGTARRFLEHLDRQEVETAWLLMTPHFRDLHDALTWQEEQQTLRRVYGPLISRSSKAFSCQETFYHAPDGNYAIVQFDSTFQNKRKAIETVILDLREPGLREIADIRMN